MDSTRLVWLESAKHGFYIVVKLQANGWHKTKHWISRVVNFKILTNIWLEIWLIKVILNLSMFDLRYDLKKLKFYTFILLACSCLLYIEITNIFVFESSATPYFKTGEPWICSR